MSFSNWWSVEKTVLRRPDALICFVFPLLASVVAFVLAFVFAPQIDDPDTAAQFSPLFSTAAQLIVTLLVALVLERRSLREFNAQRLILRGSLSYIGLGAVAAVVALDTRLTPCAYRWLFALTLGAGVGALLSVLTVAYRALAAEIEGAGEESEPPNGE